MSDSEQSQNKPAGKHRRLTELKNIGKKIAGRLNEVGLSSEDDLRMVGSVAAHRMIKLKYPNETLPVCYYLYSFEGALCDKHWNDIGQQKKQLLMAEIKQDDDGNKGEN